MTIELTHEQQQELNTLAKASQLSPEQVAREILMQFVESVVESRAMLAEAEADEAAGRVLPHEQVWHKLEERFGW